MKEVKLPKHIIKELNKASDYAKKLDECVFKFEQWVKESVDENFDFNALRAMSSEIDDEYQTEALTDIEYGRDLNED